MAYFGATNASIPAPAGKKKPVKEDGSIDEEAVKYMMDHGCDVVDAITHVVKRQKLEAEEKGK
jgi:hypothetical protein